MLLDLAAASGPLYRRVYLALKAKIPAGNLGPASRVPSTRALARDLGVSRNTVMLAYEQLARRAIRRCSPASCSATPR